MSYNCRGLFNVKTASLHHFAPFFCDKALRHHYVRKTIWPSLKPMILAKFLTGGNSRQLALERAKHFLVSCQCRGHIALALVLQGGAVAPIETYGHFTPGFARSLTGKMGTRPAGLL